MSSGPALTSPVQYYAQHVNNNNNNNSPGTTTAGSGSPTYTDPAQTKLVEVRLRRAYIVAGLLCAFSVILALIPVAYVGSATGWTAGRPPVSNWSVCWPCSSEPSPSANTVYDGHGRRKLCCAEMDSRKSMCNTIYEKSNHMVSCWQNYSAHLQLDEPYGSHSCLEVSSINSSERQPTRPKQVNGWKSSSAATGASRSNLTISALGVYVIYSKIAFVCQSTATTSQPYVHTIHVVSSNGLRHGALVRSKRRMDETLKPSSSSSSNSICFNSFLTTTVELHKSDVIYVTVQPCDLVWRRDSLSTFGMFRIG